MRNRLSWARALLIFWPVIFLVTVALEPISLLAGVLERSGRARHAVVRMWSAMVLALVAPATVSGLERIDASKPRLYVANHLSAMDIPLLYRCLPFPFRIMAHRLVFRVPLIGWWLRRSGSLEIAPESVALSRRALREAVKTLQRGMSLVVFPEGERAPKGEMLPFRRGAFYVAVKAQADIVPMAILGTYEALPLGSAHIKRTPLRLVVGDPIAAAEYTLKDLGALAERAQSAVREMYERAGVAGSS
ncbi:MAG: 1-acyl-sn-glycerol-3-phosphate acyltransferase [Acidobacteriia bacterium]|nr:1-acyl-sn-glycerol-3-phosphate acyltransferase [Terriglobia bacterium]